MRTWRGAERAADVERYLEHASTGVREHRETPGDLGAIVVRRGLDPRCDVRTEPLGASMDAVRAFVSDDRDRSKSYPGEDELLVENDLHVARHSLHCAPSRRRAA